MRSHWMLYSYDALGLGHVRRMLAIARAVLADRQDLSALLVTCSPQVESLPAPPGLDYIKLPSARKLDNRHYVSRTLRLDPDHLRDMRSTLLLETARSFEPDLLMVDKSPTGLRGELGAALECVRHDEGSARLVLGWRDILDEPARVRSEWLADGGLAALERFYDELWVYGDPEVFDVRAAYSLPDRVAERVRYLGYLAPRVDPVARAEARIGLGGEHAALALVTCGGGEDGEALLSCYLEAAARGHLPDGLRSLVVTGPFMPEDAQRRLRAAASPGVTVTSFLPGLEVATAAADVVVGMAGYNTVCEVLGAGTPAVLVPRVRHRQEQRMRAERLAALGLVEHLEPGLIAPRALAEATRRALRLERRPREGMRLDGLEQVAEHVRRLLPPMPGRRPLIDGASSPLATPSAAKESTA